MSVVDFPRRPMSGADIDAVLKAEVMAERSVTPKDNRPSWLLRLFCRHVTTITLKTIGTAVVGEGTVVLPAVEVRCSRCGEFWHAELDASEAVSGGLEG